MSYKKNLLLLIAGGAALPVAAQEERPNFVWFMTEDVSDCYLSIYNNGEFGAETPNVERLAKEGVMFTNAYSNAPVSSAARSSLFTGCYAPTYGISFHRKLELVNMPEGQHLFPAYLKAAGYHTSNAAKRDYNCHDDKDAWDIPNGKMGDWRKRPDKNMPFFHVRTNAVTHEGKLQFSEKTYKNKKTVADPSKAFIHPNHPDTDLFRYTYATFYDRINDSDRELGQLIDMLEEDGELDNTFIFYFGDNGGSLPGSKGYTTETGLTVPLVVYVPEKWRERLSVKAGSTNDGLVSFLDLGPTLFELAGIPMPEFLDGKPIFGEGITEKELEKRQVWGYGDRFDEFYAFNRTVSEGRFIYARNFTPYHPKGLYAKYRYNQLAFREWKQLYDEGKLNDLQASFFRPQGTEELYDLVADPYQEHNLASDPAYKSVLRSMRGTLGKHMIEEHDLGLYPECEWLKGIDDPKAFGDRHEKDIKRYLQLADLQLLPFAKAKKGIQKALASEDPVDRYWGATACASFGKQAKAFDAELKALLDDPVAYVRVRATVAMSHYDGVDPVAIVKKALKDVQSGAETLLILNDAAYIHDWVKDCDFGLTMESLAIDADQADWRINHLADPEY